ncbi:MAG: aminopeptidase P family protein [Endomicrobiales bacterium]|nr:aminopeptidase P family protein [Endomicrobiales bacterium]
MNNDQEKLFYGRVIKTGFGPGCYLVTSGSDVAYISGLALEGYWILVHNKRPFLVAPELLRSQLETIFPSIKILRGKNQMRALYGYAREKKVRSLRVDFGSITLRFAKSLKKRFRLRDFKGLVSNARLTKDGGELAAIGRSCRIASGAMKHAVKYLKPGRSESEIALKIEEYFLKRGVKSAFPTIVASGPNSASPHHMSGSRKIAKNDTVLIDLGCMFKGYASDLTRTYFLGKINNLQHRVYSLVKKAQKTAISALKAGVRAYAADSAARNIISRGGFGSNFIHTTGHGLGLEIHEPPRLSAKDNTVIRPGMAVTVEPGIYLKGRFGVRIEDTVLITRKGRRVLTK